MGNNNYLIDQIVKDSKMEEEVKNFPGFGKPFPKSFFSGDLYSNFLTIAKNAGYLPPWIKLQREIRKQMASTLKMIEHSTCEPKIKDAIDEINIKIAKYNDSCPPFMLRGKISLENIANMYKLWE